MLDGYKIFKWTCITVLIVFVLLFSLRCSIEMGFEVTVCPKLNRHFIATHVDDAAYNALGFWKSKFVRYQFGDSPDDIYDGKIYRAFDGRDLPVFIMGYNNVVDALVIIDPQDNYSIRVEYYFGETRGLEVFRSNKHPEFYEW